MAENYYSDNEDLKFHMEKMVDWESIVKLREDIGSADCPYSTVEEAAESYRDMLKDPVGELAANRIAPRAKDVDIDGCVCENGDVRYPDGLKKNMQDMKDAQLMGITIPREYGGIYFPKIFYSTATEIISRADASLMNFFGLQGISETISVFASDELKKKYLPPMCNGELTGAMILTEPDAGSDLGAVQTRATEDPATGHWKINGVKRFITNGCGDVLLVLARSEDPAKYGGTRGLSFFIVDKTDAVRVRRIEHKMGINGSPTCELQFTNAPAYLIGQRGRGLTKCTAWLMKEARLGVAAQSVGICQAALVEAVKYAGAREQFGKKINEFPAVAEMLLDMQVYTEAARTILIVASQMVDMQEGAEHRGLKEEIRKYDKINEVLTPIAKYYTSELCNRVASDAIQIHGGSGFTKEYIVERLYRDARITNIYEGTSQIQINWAILRLIKGDFDDAMDSLKAKTYTGELTELSERVQQAHAKWDQVIEFMRSKDVMYREFAARRVVDIMIDVFVGHQFLLQASRWDKKLRVARKFIHDMLPRVEMNRVQTMSGELTKLVMG